MVMWHGYFCTWERRRLCGPWICCPISSCSPWLYFFGLCYIKGLLLTLQVANAIIAHYFLGETFTINDLYSTITIISGATITVIFSDHEERGTSHFYYDKYVNIRLTSTDYTLDELLDLYKRLIFVIYAVFLFFCIALLYSGFRIVSQVFLGLKVGDHYFFFLKT